MIFKEKQTHIHFFQVYKKVLFFMNNNKTIPLLNQMWSVYSNCSMLGSPFGVHGVAGSWIIPCCKRMVAVWSGDGDGDCSSFLLLFFFGSFGTFWN